VILIARVNYRRSQRASDLMNERSGVGIILVEIYTGSELTYKSFIFCTYWPTRLFIIARRMRGERLFI
jgi:hypothetical protein